MSTFLSASARLPRGLVNLWNDRPPNPPPPAKESIALRMTAGLHSGELRALTALGASQCRGSLPRGERHPPLERRDGLCSQPLPSPWHRMGQNRREDLGDTAVILLVCASSDGDCMLFPDSATCGGCSPAPICALRCPLAGTAKETLCCRGPCRPL